MSHPSLPDSKADILIIDDTPDNLRLLNQMLSASYKVRLAPSGEVGLTAARAMPPDLILLDVMMPDLNGYEIATHLKAEPHTADIPIIIISALDDTDSKVRGFTVGAVDYVTKPFQEKEVLARIDTHLALRTLHRQLQTELAERRQAENALRESEERFRFLASSFNDVIYTLDTAQRHTGVYGDWVRKAGLTPEFFLGKTARDIFGAEAARVHEEANQRALAGEPVVYEWSAPSAEGVVYYQTAVSPLQNSQREIIGVVGVGRDITARKRAELELRESELLYESLVEVSPLSICRKDLAGRFTFANRRFLEASNLTLAELVGKTDFELHPPELAEKYRRDDRAVIDSGKVWELIEERALLDGESIIVQSIKTPIRDGTGKINGVQISFWDITARRRAEEALRESEAKYHKIFNNEIDAICIFDVETRQILDVNNAYLKLYGYTRDEVLALTTDDISAEPENTQAAIQSARATGDVVIPERNHRRKDGTVIQVELSAGAYTWNGRNVMFAIARDITARKQAEAQREAALNALRELNAELEQRVADRTRELTEANVRLAELSNLRSEFITRISHELRTPLANIKLYHQLLQHGKPEKHEQYLHTLHEQTDRLQRLIEDLLDVSHLSLDEIGVQATIFDANTLARTLVSDCTSLALDRGLTLTLLPAPDHPLLNTDRNLLRQALRNVLTNALNYTPRTGTITVQTDRITAPDGEWVTMAVRDTGPGIAAQDLARIFEPFFRGAAAADYKIPGTGVGLSIAQRLIGRLGGRITVASQPGQGAEFTIWLRAASS